MPVIGRKARRIRLSLLARKNKLITIDKSSEDTLVVLAPEVLSLEFGNIETLLFLRRVRDCADNLQGKRRVVIDLAPTKTLEIGAALALVAEFARWQRKRGIRLSPSLVKDWHPEVVTELNSLGFFKLLRTKIPPGLVKPGPKAWIQFTSDVKTIGKAAVLLKRRLASEIAFNPAQGQNVYVSLVEAMKNAFDHAYPDDIVEKSIDAHAGRRWWMAASIDRDKQQLKISFLDLGITIPASLPKSWMWKHVEPRIKLGSDASIIREALRYGQSSKGEAHRGKGFRDITRLVYLPEPGEVSVLSRSGLCIISPNQLMLVDVNEALSGTLITWYFALLYQERS